MATEVVVMAVIKASRPVIQNPHDKIAFALHSTFLATGYTLTATGISAFSDDIYFSPPSHEVGIYGWNDTEESYGFVYSMNDEEGSNKTVFFKCLVMGDYLVIDALCSKHDDREISVQINVNEYIGEDNTNYDCYTNLAKLVSVFNSDILKEIEDLPKVDTSSHKSLRLEQNQREHQNPKPGFMGAFSGAGSTQIGPDDPRWFSFGTAPGYRGAFGGAGSTQIGPDDPRWFSFGAAPGYRGASVGRDNPRSFNFSTAPGYRGACRGAGSTQIGPDDPRWFSFGIATGVSED